jgi:sigma-B regulation protein RsbU (phosphoserine phosphatase)
MSEQRPLSIIEFLTDGSLPRLADALTELTGARVTLVAKRGEAVRQRNGSPPWTIDGPGEHAEAVAQALERWAAEPFIDVPGLGVLVVLHVGSQAIGGLLLEASGAEITRGLRAVVEHVAATVSERCSEEALLRARNDELSLLYRLSSLLVAAQDLDETLDVAVRACMRILEADAAVVYLVEGPEKRLVRHAAAGLSQTFLDRFDALEAPRAADRQALEGGVLAVADLSAHHAAPEAFRKAAAEEGLRSMLSTGLFFKNNPLGVVRLFTRSRVAFSGADQALARSLGEQVSAAVEAARLAEVARANRAMRRQVKLAGDVQQRLLARKPPEHPGLDVATRYIPSSELGGDFYDLIDLKEYLGLVVGDVVGKGVPAALLMASVRSSFRAHAQRLTRRHDVEEVVRRVNRTLAGDTRSNEFATGFLGRVTLASMQLRYTNAGHEPPFVIRPGGNGDDHRPIELRAGGPLMGVDHDATYESGVFDLLPGDTLVAYTDGVTDAMDFDANRFGRQRLYESVTAKLAAEPGCSAKAVADHIVWDIRRFVGLNEERDDITILVMRVRAEAGQ